MNSAHNRYSRRSKFHAAAIVTVLAAVGAVAPVAMAQDSQVEEGEIHSEQIIPLSAEFMRLQEEAEEESAPRVPRPGEDEEMSLERFKDDYSTLKEMVDRRLGQLSVDGTFDPSGESYEGLPGVDTSAYRSELDQQAAIQREIRLLNLRLQQAKVATELWELLYANDAGSNSGEDDEDEETAERGDGPWLMMVTSDGLGLFRDAEEQVYFAEVGPEGNPLLDTMQGVEEVMTARAAAAEEAAREAMEEEEETPEENKPRDMPSIISISGVGNALQARLRVRDVGVFDVQEGMQLPDKMTVSRIERNKVTIRREGRNYELYLQ